MCGIGVPPTDATSSGSDSPTRLRRCPRGPRLRHRSPSHHQLSRAWRGSRGARRPTAAVLSPLVIPLIKQYHLTVVNVPRALRCGRGPCYPTTVEPTKVSTAAEWREGGRAQCRTEPNPVQMCRRRRVAMLDVASTPNLNAAQILTAEYRLSNGS